MKTTVIVTVLLGLLTPGLSADQSKFAKKPRYVDLMSDVAERQRTLSQHRFFKMLGDESIPASKRMSFTPYIAYFVLSFADVLANVVYIPNPQSELEERINVCVEEDTFHYNLFFNDMRLLGYTVDRFGSFDGVLRHLWGDESKAFRECVYEWVYWLKKFDDPLITLVTFEVVEASGSLLFETVHAKVFLPEGGLKGLQYFGGIHVELEKNHTQTDWFKDGMVSSLDNLEVTELQMEQALEVIDALFKRFDAMFDAMYNLAVAEDSIRPEKYKVEGTPALHEFPAEHPNRRVQKVGKDEL